MIPRADIECRVVLPRGPLWTPRREDMGDEGFGGFRNTWSIRRPGLRDSRRIIETEVALLAVADRVSSDSNEFDEAARALEHGERDYLPEGCADVDIAFEAIDAYAR